MDSVKLDDQSATQVYLVNERKEFGVVVQAARKRYVDQALGMLKEEEGL